jgi:hypothetical protein
MFCNKSNYGLLCYHDKLVHEVGGDIVLEFTLLVLEPCEDAIRGQCGGR